MQFEFFVHGVPGQHEIWHAENKKISYLDNFYDTNITDDVKYVVSPGPNGGFCYSFLVYKNVQSAVERVGGYFGMTLWCDSYLYAVKELISIFDVLFNQTISLGIFKNESGTLKYTKKEFSLLSAELKKLDEKFNVLFAESFNSPSFFKPTSGISKSGRKNEICLIDVDNKEIFECVKKGEKVEIAYYFETKASLKSKDSSSKKLQDAQKEITELTQKFKTKETEVSDQKGKIETLEKAKRNLEVQLESAQKENKAVKDIQDLKKVFKEKEELFSRVCNSLDAISHKTGNWNNTEGNETDEAGGSSSTGDKCFGSFEDIRQILFLLLLVVSLAINVSYSFGWINYRIAHVDQNDNSENDESTVVDSLVVKVDTVDKISEHGVLIPDSLVLPMVVEKLGNKARLNIEPIKSGHVSTRTLITFSLVGAKGNKAPTEKLTNDFKIYKNDQEVNNNIAVIVNNEKPGEAKIVFYEPGDFQVVYTHGNGEEFPRTFTVENNQ